MTGELTKSDVALMLTYTPKLSYSSVALLIDLRRDLNEILSIFKLIPVIGG